MRITVAKVLLGLLSHVSVSSSVAQQALHALKHTSWSLTHLLPNSNDPLPISHTEQSVISALRFKENEQLVATFLPCTDHMEMIYQNLGANSSLQITDSSSNCPECTTPQQQAQNCYISGGSSPMAAAFVDALFNTSTYQVTDDGSTLHLFDPDGIALMELMSCQTESALAGTSWHPTTIWTEDPPMNPLQLVDHRSVTTYFEHCEISGRAACNRYSGYYRTSANEEFIHNGLASTQMWCEGPPSTIEFAFLSAMEKVASYDIDNEAKTMVLLDSSGNDMISFIRCERVELINTPWWSNAAIRSRSWNVGEKQVTMQFGEDNMVRGKTLCGQDYEIAYTLGLDNISMTFQVQNWPDVQCDRADFEHDFQHESSIKFEQQFPDVLGEARSFEIDECTDRLIIQDEDGMLLLSFGTDDGGGTRDASGLEDTSAGGREKEGTSMEDTTEGGEEREAGSMLSSSSASSSSLGAVLTLSGVMILCISCW